MSAVLRARVSAADATARATALTMLGRAGVAVAADSDRSPGTVTVVAAGSIDEALAVLGRPGVVMADRFSADGVRRALRAGVGAIVESTRATPARLRAALQSAHDGDGRLPHDLLVRLLGQDAVPQAPALTARQVSVLRLMADGFDNTSIADELDCSQHTVKNVIYDLMSRLQARTRAHAVAGAVRAGVI